MLLKFSNDYEISSGRYREVSQKYTNELCAQLKSDFKVDISFEIKPESGKYACIQHFNDKRRQDLKATFPDGFSAPIRLLTLYSQLGNLQRLMDIIDKLEDDGYHYNGHTEPSLVSSGAIYIRKYPEMASYTLQLSDSEIDTYTAILEKLKKKRELLNFINEAYEVYGTTIETNENGFSLKDVATGERKLLPDSERFFSPHYGVYEFAPEAIDSAITFVKSLPRID